MTELEQYENSDASAFFPIGKDFEDVSDQKFWAKHKVDKRILEDLIDKMNNTHSDFKTSLMTYEQYVDWKEIHKII